jgi:hypothetical protein
MNETLELAPLDYAQPISWWPLAPGWWLVIIFLLAAMILLCHWLLKRKRANAFRKQALAELKNISCLEPSHAQLTEVNALLKRVAVTLYPRSIASIKYGNDWLTWLDRTGNTKGFTQGEGQVLKHGLYQAKVTYNQRALITLVERWIKQVKYYPNEEQQHA